MPFHQAGVTTVAEKGLISAENSNMADQNGRPTRQLPSEVTGTSRENSRIRRFSFPAWILAFTSTLESCSYCAISARLAFLLCSLSKPHQCVLLRSCSFIKTEGGQVRGYYEREQVFGEFVMMAIWCMNVLPSNCSSVTLKGLAWRPTASCPCTDYTCTPSAPTHLERLHCCES